MVAPSARVALDIDGEHERVARRNVTARGWRFSIQPAEEHLSHPLPRPAGIHHDALAGGKWGRISNGIGTRRILRRLLLGFDGPTFRRRRYEHYLDRRFNSAHMRRENAPGARANKPRDGRPPRNLGNLRPGRLLELWYVLSGGFALRGSACAAKAKKLVAALFRWPRRRSPKRNSKSCANSKTRWRPT